MLVCIILTSSQQFTGSYPDVTLNCDVSLLTCAAYQNHRQVEASAPWTAWLSAELPASVAWQLSRASGKIIWTDTHKSTCIQTFQHFHIQVHKQQHARAHWAPKQARRTLTETSMLAWASAFCWPVCKGNVERGSMVCLPLFKISQKRSLFFLLSVQ